MLPSLLLASATLAAPAAVAPAAAPNVLLVTIDTLRADHVGAYGYAAAQTPTIDRLAREGVRLEDAVVQVPQTRPSHACIMTGRLPYEHGIRDNYSPPLPAALPTLATVLGGRGWDTAGFVGAYPVSRPSGLDHGFAHYDDPFAGGDSTTREARTERRAQEVVDHALAWLARPRSRPFLAWVHLFDPHAPYEAPAPYGTRFARHPYDGEVAYADAQVGRLLDALRALGLEERTLVVFAADHGEDLHEHNRYFFHSPSMYSSSLRIPLILALPGVLPRSGETDHPASLVDVAPTALGLLGLPPPSSFQGVNLLPGGALPPRPARTAVFSETNGRIFSVSTPEWRLVYNPDRLVPEAAGGPYPIGRTELFDRRHDPREQGNVAALHPDEVRALVAEVEAWRRRDLREGDASAVQTIDPGTAEELRALGYVVH